MVAHSDFLLVSLLAELKGPGLYSFIIYILLHTLKSESVCWSNFFKKKVVRVCLMDVKT